MDVLGLAASAIATCFKTSVLENVLDDRMDAAGMGAVDRLRRLVRGAEPSQQIDLAYAMWWACLQAAVSGCCKVLVEQGHDPTKLFSALAELRGSRNPDEAPVLVLRRRMFAEISTLEGNRSRYFAGWRSLAEDPELLSRVSVTADAEGDELAAALFRPWFEDRCRELERSAGIVLPVTPDELLVEFDADLRLSLADCLKRDDGARAAYEATALIAMRDGDGATSWPTVDEVIAQLDDRLSTFGRELLESVSDTATALDSTIRLQASLIITSQDELKELAADLQRSEERRRKTEDFAIAAAGRNTRRLVEKRVQALTDEPLVGREPSFLELERVVTSSQGRSIVISAPAGYGKSALLAHWLREAAPLWGHVAYHFVDASQGAETSLRFKLFSNLLGQMLPYYDGLSLDLGRDPESLVGELLGGGYAPANPDERLIVLVDGLDEVLDWDAGGPRLMLDGAPKHAIVIATIRAEADREKELLEGWEHDEVIRLGPLTESDVAAAIAADDQAHVAALADDDAVVRHLTEVTSGIPLYVHYALKAVDDRVEHGLAPVSDLTGTGNADGVRQDATEIFGAFLRTHITQLHKSIPLLEQTAAYRLLHYLVAAQMPLHHEDASELDINTLAASDLRVMRWIESPALNTYALPHPFLGEALAHALQPGLGRARRELRELAYDWRARPTHYAAQALVALAAESGSSPAERHRSLIALGSDREFLKLQAKMIPDDPLLPARTIDAANDAATAEGDIGATIELAQLRIEIRAALESPARALKNRASMTRVLALVEAVSPDYQHGWWAYLIARFPDRALAERTAIDRWAAAAAMPRGLVVRAPNADMLIATFVHLLVQRQELAASADLAATIVGTRERASALALIAGAVCRHGDAALAHDLARQARETLMTLERPAPGPTILTAGDMIQEDLSTAPEPGFGLVAVAEMLHAAGLPDDARAAMREALDSWPAGHPRFVEETVYAAKVAAEIGEDAIARDVAQKLDGVASRMRRAARQGSYDRERDYPGAAAALALAYAGDTRAAITAARRATSKPDAGLNTLISAAQAFAVAGDVAAAERTAHRAFALVRAAAQSNGGEPSSAVLNVLIKKLMYVGPDEVRQVLHARLQIIQAREQTRMEAEPLREIAASLTRLGDLDEAQRVEDLALAAVRSLSDAVAEIEVAIIACLRASRGHVAQALEMLSSLQSQEPRTEGLIAIAKMLAESPREDDEALHIGGLALTEISAEHERHMRSRLIFLLTDALARTGVPEAVALADSASRLDQLSVRAIAARSLAAAGATEVARATATQIAESLPLLGDFEPDLDRILECVTEALAASDDVDGALRIAHSAPERPSKLLVVAEQLLASGDTDRAGSVLDEALAEFAQPIDREVTRFLGGGSMQSGEVHSRARARIVAAEVALGLGRREAAIELCDATTIGDVALREEDFSRSPQEIWVDVRARTGTTDSAADEIDALDDQSARCVVLAALSRAVTTFSGPAAGAPLAHRAAKAAAGVQDLNQRAGLLTAVATALAQADQRDDARALVAEAVGLGEQVTGTRAPRRLLAQTVRPLAEAGDVQGARSAAMEALSGITDLISLQQHNDGTTAIALRPLVEHGLEADAALVAKSIDDPWLRTEALAIVAKSLAIADHRPEAITTALDALSHLP